MKKMMLSAIAAIFVAPFLYAQEAPLVAANANAKEVVIVIKNNSENKISVFAGPKEGIREPKLNIYGGLSTNKVYVREGDVVCIMNDEKKPKSCTVVKPGVEQIEVNTSATTLAAKQ